SRTSRGRTPPAERSPGWLDPAPPRLTQAVDAEGNQAECREDEQELAERLVAQGEQRLVDAARLGRLVGDGRLEHQDADEREHHAAGRGPDHAQPLDKPAHPRAQLRKLEVLQELAADSL